MIYQYEFHNTKNRQELLPHLVTAWPFVPNIVYLIGGVLEGQVGPEHQFSNFGRAV